MSIGVIVDSRIPILGTPITDVLARSPAPTVLTSVNAVQLAGMNVTQGNNLPPAWQGDSTTGRLAPEIPGGLHMEKVLLVTTGQPVVLTPSQQDRE